ATSDEAGDEPHEPGDRDPGARGTDPDRVEPAGLAERQDDREEDREGRELSDLDPEVERDQRDRDAAALETDRAEPAGEAEAEEPEEPVHRTRRGPRAVSRRAGGRGLQRAGDRERAVIAGQELVAKGISGAGARDVAMPRREISEHLEIDLERAGGRTVPAAG